MKPAYSWEAPPKGSLRHWVDGRGRSWPIFMMHTAHIESAVALARRIGSGSRRDQVQVLERELWRRRTLQLVGFEMPSFTSLGGA